jgi:hypothetical protein
LLPFADYAGHNLLNRQAWLLPTCENHGRARRHPQAKGPHPTERELVELCDITMEVDDATLTGATFCDEVDDATLTGATFCDVVLEQTPPGHDEVVVTAPLFVPRYITRPIIATMAMTIAATTAAENPTRDSNLIYSSPRINRLESP